MKHYRNLNGCISKMHKAMYEAYDKGYKQGKADYERPQSKADYERPQSKWNKEALGVQGIWYRCENCKRYAIADYLFCPQCGSPMTEDSYGTEN